MKVTKRSDGLSVHAIAGTHVVLLAMNMAEEDCEGLLGFAIHRTDHEAEEAYWLQGMKTFAETDPGVSMSSKFSSLGEYMRLWDMGPLCLSGVGDGKGAFSRLREYFVG